MWINRKKYFIGYLWPYASFRILLAILDMLFILWTFSASPYFAKNGLYEQYTNEKKSDEEHIKLIVFKSLS